MSLVSMIETQVVERRKWLLAEEMLDGVALASLLPGPMAVNTVAYVGYRLKGAVGALVCGVAVLLPTTIFMLVLADLYFRYGTLPQVERVFAGVLPAVAAIVLSVCFKMASKNLKAPGKWVAFTLAAILLLLAPRAFRIYITFGLVAVYGIAGWLIFRLNRKGREVGEESPSSGFRLTAKQITAFLVLICIVVAGILPLPYAPNGIAALMTTFGSMSLTLFGGGYVFIPMIQDVVVDNYGWLTAREFIDGIALGQVTPGPILISACFIGQKVAGIPGALLSTTAIFFPPAILMVLMAGMLEQIRGSAAVQAVLKGIRIAVIALIFRAFINIFMMALPAQEEFAVQGLWVPVAIFSLSFIVLIKYKVDVLWIIPAAGIIGFFLG